MAEKIATHAQAMNALYAGEIKRIASKTAGEVDTKTEGPTPADAQAFKDKAEYIKTLEDVLAEDKREGWNPNDEILD